MALSSRGRRHRQHDAQLAEALFAQAILKIAADQRPGAVAQFLFEQWIDPQDPAIRAEHDKDFRHGADGALQGAMHLGQFARPPLQLVLLFPAR
jgi:hypothetical protein